MWVNIGDMDERKILSMSLNIDKKVSYGRSYVYVLLSRRDKL